MSDTLNMMEITIEKFTNLIKLDLEDENYDPVIGIGKSGVGKTMSIYELTKELGIGFCELRLVTLNEVDLLGIPIIENGRTTYASNDLLPNVERDGEAGILVLDEITSATSTIRAAAYQLLDSKRALGNYKLPDKWKVVALGNGMTDGGVFQGMESAFLSRATCYRIEPNLDVWKHWAISNGVNSSVIAYLTWDPSKLHEFNPDEIASVFPCPRSWTALSKKLNARESKKGGLLELDEVEIYAGGAIGQKLAPSFSAFYAYNSKTISPEDILSGKDITTDLSDMDPEVIYLMIQSLIKQISVELAENKTDTCTYTPECFKRIANVCNWIINVSKQRLDYALTAFKDLASVSDFKDIILTDELDELCPELLEFAGANSVTFTAKANN